MTKYEFGNYLCRLRESNRLTQRQLAYHLGVTDKAISKWENGETQPKADMLAAIAHFFGITVDALLNCGKGAEPQSVRREESLSPLYVMPAEETGTVQHYPSLLLESDVVTNNYMCTWGQQKRMGAIKGTSAPDALDAKLLFEEGEFYHPASREMRRDLIFLLDDGWDVPYNRGLLDREEYVRCYGAVDPDPERFPGFGKTPVERLKTLNRKVQKLGYRGVGLWIAVQQSGEREYDPKAAEAYWEERARWCHEAGVLYWKVDWGYHCADDDYREMMTRVARKAAPGLVIEHAIMQQPLSFLMPMKNGADFPTIRQERLKRQMTFSDAYRTYDLVEPFFTSATLSRAHEALAAEAERRYGALGMVNVESEAYIAAALGCITGIMDYTKEMEACIRWHRTAPPFSAFDAEYRYSEEILTDNYFYDANVHWVQCGGKYFEESVPAVMARNCELPEVKPCGEHRPFVAASKNPITGVYSVAAYRRTVDPNGTFIAPADVTLKIDEPEALVGAFGVFNSFSIECEAGYPDDFRVYAQNLLDDMAVDITEFVRMNGKSITLDGRDLRMIGRIPEGDPALAIQVRKAE